jgi:hypothetical protein
VIGLSFEAERGVKMATNSDGSLASSVVRRSTRRSPFKYVPGFLYILVLYVAGSFLVPDPRTTWELGDGYRLSWDEVLMVAAAIMAIAEQLKVSHPGVDNTTEAILMAAIAGVQVLLFALGAAGVAALGIFNNTEFLLLTLISMIQAVIGILINGRTMRRSIDIVPGE